MYVLLIAVLMISPGLSPNNASFMTQPSSQSEDEPQKALPTNTKLKNELCINFLQYGYCRYNTKCQFAHGKEELLQNKTQNIKYKTKKCHSFFQKGFCGYGERCNFLHIPHDHVQPQFFTSKQVLKEYREVWNNKKTDSSLFPALF